MTANQVHPSQVRADGARRGAARLDAMTVGRAAMLALAVAAAAYISLYAPRDLGLATPLWMPNALTLACVLRSRRGHWPIWALAGFLGNVAADLLVRDPPATSVMLAACNSAEVLICGLGLRRMLPGGFDPGQLRHLGLGAVLALAGALTSAALAAAYLGLIHGRDFPLEFAIWTMADLLGIMILTPCLLILADARTHLAERPLSWSDAAILLTALAAETYVFAQTQFPLLYLVAVATLTVSMTVEMLGAAIMVLATAALAIGFTFAGQGPIVLSSSGWTEQLLQMQAFVAVCSVLSLQSAARQQQRRAYARALTVAVAEAERSARVKAEFLANMSHEIRTPLTSILGFASLLSEKKLDEEAGRYAGRVLSASRNLLALVNDVLDFSKLEAGQLEIKPKPGDPAECGRDVVELFLAQAQAKRLSLRFSGRGLPGHVLADFDRVRQVLMNLVGNAVKFTDAGSVRVEARYDAEAGRLSYRVIDTGPGLDADGQAKLFQRFSQVDASTSRAHGGSGLGLAISRGLAEAMGGAVGVESVPGQGATFWFEVPATACEPEAKTTLATLDIGALQGLKVLLADDNAANRELIRSLLSPLGVALTTADGGAAAVSLAELQGFQLILMDLRMPGVDGWAAARAIRSGAGPNRETPMLAFSADVTAGDDVDPDLFQGLVRKPIEMAELLHAIAHWTAGAPQPPDAKLDNQAVKRPQRRR